MPSVGLGYGVSPNSRKDRRKDRHQGLEIRSRLFPATVAVEGRISSPKTQPNRVANAAIEKRSARISTRWSTNGRGF